MSAVPRPALLPILLIAAVGCALRIASAQGGLWLDEAWSAVFARDVATPAGVFLNINHDNNHHLNTLWLQVVGFDAPPVLQRALSIATGSAAIIVAGLIAARRSPTAAVITAALFAVSPILVTYGSEARGYAPMTLALLAAILIVDRWLDDRERPAPTLGLTVVCILGMLANLTMAFGIVALGGWVVARVWIEDGARAAAKAVLRMVALPVSASIVTILMIIMALPGAKGFHFGAYQPFTGGDFANGLSDVAAYTFGTGGGYFPPLIAATATLAALASVRALRPRAAFYVIAIIGLPMAVLVLQLGNAGITRYYLLSSVALLFLAGELAALAVLRRDPLRYAGVGALALILFASGISDIELIANRRADPGRLVAVVARAQPGGSTITVERPRATAIVETAAAAAHFPLAVTPCAPWLFVDRDGADPFPATPRQCGARYRALASGSPTGLSGTHWRLYARQ